MKTGYGEFIKKHRLSSGFKSQRSLAEKSGIHNATIARIEQEIQKPEVRTLQTLSQYLTTTSYVELMVACGYWSEDDLLESPLSEGTDKNRNRLIFHTPGTGKTEFLQKTGRATREIKETPASYEEEFLGNIDLSDKELLDRFNLQIDGQDLTEEETQMIIASIRSLRTLKSKS